MCDYCKCGKKAVWFYMPARDDNHYAYCDDCVPRGCSCHNWYTSELSPDYIFKDMISGIIDYTPKIRFFNYLHEMGDYNLTEFEIRSYWTTLDEFGREHPCCEYMYDED